jgi:hypothetical protein
MVQIKKISMASGFVIRKNHYYDSVFLMRISKRISDAKGVQQNAVLMGSDNNKKLLSNIGVHDTQIDTAHPNDLIVAVIADTQQIVNDVLDKLDEYLEGGVQSLKMAWLKILTLTWWRFLSPVNTQRERPVRLLNPV